jgi:hypothetical protein
MKKKTWFFASLLTSAVLLFVTVTAVASPAANHPFWKTPEHILGPQATPFPTEIGGNGNDNGQGQGHGHGHGNGNGQGDDNGQGNHGNPHLIGKLLPHGKGVVDRGTISAVDATSLTLTLGDGTSVSFVLNSSTIIKIPTLHGTGTWQDLSKGEQVIVMASLDASQQLVASMILLIPGKPELVHRVGTVTNYQPGVSITIEDKDGNSFTFLITPETRILPPDLASQLGVGSRVTIVAPRDVAHGTLTAAAIVVHPAFSGGTGTPTSTATATATPLPTTATETATLTDTATP